MSTTRFNELLRAIAQAAGSEPCPIESLPESLRQVSLLGEAEAAGLAEFVGIYFPRVSTLNHDGQITHHPAGSIWLPRSQIGLGGPLADALAKSAAKPPRQRLHIRLTRRGRDPALWAEPRPGAQMLSPQNELSEADQALLTAVHTIIGSHPPGAHQAAMRLAEALSDRARWRALVRYYWTSDRPMIKRRYTDRSQQLAELRRARPRKSEFLGVDPALRTITALHIHACEVLVGPGWSHLPTLEQAWDTVFAFWVHFVPDARLESFGLASIARWTQPDTCDRASAAPTELESPEGRRTAFERGRIALARIQATLAEPSNPSIALLHGLNELGATFLMASAFRDLAARRRQTQDLHLDLLNVLAKSDPEAARERMTSPPQFNEPTEYIATLRASVARGHGACERVLENLRAGGGAVLDEALCAGTKARSTELGVKVREAEMVLTHLESCLMHPTAVMDEYVKAMPELREWFQHAWRQLATVLEQHGLRAPDQGPAVRAEPKAGPPHVKAASELGSGDKGRQTEPFDDLVTLDQAAAVVNKSKRTLERYLQKGDFPDPDVPGGDGKAHRWYWRNLRPALERHFRPDLPARFPGSRVV